MCEELNRLRGQSCETDLTLWEEKRGAGDVLISGAGTSLGGQIDRGGIDEDEVVLSGGSRVVVI